MRPQSQKMLEKFELDRIIIEGPLLLPPVNVYFKTLKTLNKYRVVYFLLSSMQ